MCLCKFESGCRATAVYGYEYKKPMYCRQHSKDDMVDCKSLRCNVEGCRVYPSFGSKGGKKERCASHKLPTDVNLKDAICKFEGCTKLASYNHPDTKGKIYCGKHKECGMIPVSVRKCAYEGCLHQPSFNYIGQKIAMYCYEHKEPNMVDVKSTKCKLCSTQASFGYEGKGATHCHKHKKEDMISLYKVRCSCGKQCTYGFEGSQATRCKDHKEKGMKSLNRKKCELCDMCASFGYSDPVRCSLHKEEGMWNINKSSHLCELCTTKAIYGYEVDGVKKLLRCSTHKTSSMKDMVHSYCKSCGCHVVHNDEKLCSDCNPDARKKIDELKIVNWLKDTYPDLKFKHNKCFSIDASTRIFPDIFIKCHGYRIIVEVDEYQHKQYNTKLEEERMRSLQVFLGKRVIFIRYNPDSYRIKGQLSEITEEERLRILKNTIDNCLKQKPRHRLNIIKLFYDQK